MLNVDVIQETETRWASPIVFAPEKDSTLQFCEIYWVLNAVTMFFWYCTPILD